ncbi:CaiB/BaiF CoA transferase family protein [Crocinitomix catalasitica]|uniref:CaiB/BaiF CoA transferase family protein n=1 Tax=Crocinitomix catalasitica TaxID=184607 RepID=UPI000482A646|nr:CaiB/BaiF CoA-transferase family protein [Crocinitomix catalasitica]
MLSHDFKDLKIIEVASVLAGPSVGLFFAEMGAHVLKVENKKTGGDVTRSWKLPTEDKNNGISAYYASVNTGKDVIFLDLTVQSDLEQLYQEISSAQILIANFKHGAAEKLGLDFATVRKYNSRIIYGEISGFGSESDRVAYDLILQAESGFMSMNGQPDSSPVKMPVALIDILAGHQLKEGILVAMYRQALGKIQAVKIEVSLYDTALASLANQATNWLMAHHIPEKMGSLHPNIAPYGELFTTKDEVQITFAIGNDKQFKELCNVLDISELSIDPLFLDNAKRVINRIALAKQLQAAIGKIDIDGHLDRFHQRMIPVAEIKNLKTVFESAAAQKLISHSTVDGQSIAYVRSSIFKISE